MLAIGLAVHYLLTNSPVNDLVGGNIFPLAVPNAGVSGENLPFPHITYSRSSLTPTYAKECPGSDSVNVSVDVWARSYKESITIIQAVRTAIENKSGEFAGVDIQNSELVSADENFDLDGYYGQTLVFEFR